MLSSPPSSRRTFLGDERLSTFRLGPRYLFLIPENQHPISNHTTDLKFCIKSHLLRYAVEVDSFSVVFFLFKAISIWREIQSTLRHVGLPKTKHARERLGRSR